MVWFNLFGKVQDVLSLKKEKPAYYLCAKFALEVPTISLILEFLTLK